MPLCVQWDWNPPAVQVVVLGWVMRRGDPCAGEFTVRRVSEQFGTAESGQGWGDPGKLSPLSPAQGRSWRQIPVPFQDLCAFLPPAARPFVMAAAANPRQE